jgi:adenylate kinase family enzyme
MRDPGNKIVIVGVSASGKSTFARKLGNKLGLPVVFVDAIMWRPGWNYIGDAATVSKLNEESLKPEWIIEGYIEKDARAFVFDRAETIIYLDYSPLTSSLRYIQRWLKHRKNSRPELEGSPEKFSFKFLKLVWTKGEAASLDTFLQNMAKQEKIIRFTSPKVAENFLLKLEKDPI